MAADVSTGHGGDEKKEELMTRDLLGGGGERELWEKKLELLSRKSSCCSQEEEDGGPVYRQLHDLNLPPPPSPTTSFASVCTLEKVKFALERAMRVPKSDPKSDGYPPSSSVKRKEPSSVKRKEPLTTDDPDGGGAMMVTVCPGCFQYLLISTVDPTCPKCDRHVPIPKKARIDLNYSSSSSSN